MSPAHFWLGHWRKNPAPTDFLTQAGRVPVADRAELPGGLCPQSLTAQLAATVFTLKG